MNDLIPLYKEMAADGQNFRGLSLLQHRKQIGQIIRSHNTRTILDFGCGRGDPYRGPHKVWREWGVKWFDIWLYDPAFEQHDKLPPEGKQFDLVICSDVLEHIPEADVDTFVRELFVRARVVVWASVCTRPAKKTFPQTGENLHVTLKPFAWWYDKLTEHAAGLPFTLVETP